MLIRPEPVRKSSAVGRAPAGLVAAEITLVGPSVCRYRRIKNKLESEVVTMGRTLFGILLGVVLAPLVLLAWFRFGHPPVAAADQPLPLERWLTQIPLHSRIDRDLLHIKASPVQPGESTFVSGAEVYRDQCAACHGFHGKSSSFAAHMFPPAPQLWEKHKNSDAVGVSDDPAVETYWKVANGIRLTGMPSYKNILSDQEMWEVSLLLASADKPLPPAALDILKGQSASPAPVAAAPKAR
jgi:thiosulfate dehydrogenase